MPRVRAVASEATNGAPMASDADHDQDDPQGQEPDPLAADGLQLVAQDSPDLAKIGRRAHRDSPRYGFETAW